jgi:hypothetical protein
MIYFSNATIYGGRDTVLGKRVFAGKLVIIV